MLKSVQLFFVFILLSNTILAQNSTGNEDAKEANIAQYYSIKAGFYNPGNKDLNNGLIFGLDGITEFYKYNFFLSGDIDFYQKKTINIYAAPDITDQSILLFPLHVNFAYKIAQIPDADTKFYAGIGGGYYLYFYKGTYQTSSGGVLFGGTTNNDVSKNSGSGFFSVFGRILIGKVFIEPLYYFASAKNDKVNGYALNVNPSGFTISLGFQY